MTSKQLGGRKRLLKDNEICFFYGLTNILLIIGHYSRQTG